ncbi:MAG: DUF3267 domain-containing protein [Planctomycetes bacterium]|nr:DUF3267 domain-containing protein [Planctomycetota bacterium]
MFIPGEFIAVLTFPGVIVHEFAHQLFCRFSRVAIADVCYFRYGNPSGYVVHETPRKLYQHILIGIGPFFVNTIIGALITLPAALPVIQFKSGGGLLDFFLIWLGVSIAMHSFPSIGDAQSIWQAVWRKETPIFIKLIGVPVVGLIYCGAVGSVVWLDLFYGIGIAMLIPNLLIKMLA